MIAPNAARAMMLCALSHSAEKGMPALIAEARQAGSIPSSHQKSFSLTAVPIRVEQISEVRERNAESLRLMAKSLRQTRQLGQRYSVTPRSLSVRGFTAHQLRSVGA